MPTIRQQLVTDDSLRQPDAGLAGPARSRGPPAAAEEAEALDAFSRRRGAVAETLMPAVVNIRAQQGARAERAPACCSRPTAFC